MKKNILFLFGAFLCSLFLQCSNEPEIEAPLILSCPDNITDFDGNSYSVVTIGNQCWMAENLRTTHYSDGTPIPLGTSQDTIGPADNPEVFYFNFERENILGDVDYSELHEHLELTSKYYTWLGATKSSKSGNESEIIQGVCPKGWRLPNLNDWHELVEFAGGDIAGLNLKSDNLKMWYSGNESSFKPGNNEFEFNATATGRRGIHEYNSGPGESGSYWSSTKYSATAAFTPVFSSGLDWVQFDQRSKFLAVCVRCIKTE